MNKTYDVEICRDDRGILKNRLNEIAQKGGRILNVIWTPGREIVLSDNNIFSANSGFTIVVEYDQN